MANPVGIKNDTEKHQYMVLNNYLTQSRLSKQPYDSLTQIWRTHNPHTQNLEFGEAFSKLTHQYLREKTEGFVFPYRNEEVIEALKCESGDWNLIEKGVPETILKQREVRLIHNIYVDPLVKKVVNMRSLGPEKVKIICENEATKLKLVDFIKQCYQTDGAVWDLDSDLYSPDTFLSEQYLATLFVTQNKESVPNQNKEQAVRKGTLLSVEIGDRVIQREGWNVMRMRESYLTDSRVAQMLLMKRALLLQGIRPHLHPYHPIPDWVKLEDLSGGPVSLEHLRQRMSKHQGCQISLSGVTEALTNAGWAIREDGMAISYLARMIL